MGALDCDLLVLVVGSSGRVTIGTGIADCGFFLGFGVPGVTVVLVAVVVEDIGREGILDGGLEPESCFLWLFRGTSGTGSWLRGGERSVFERERDRVRKL